MRTWTPAQEYKIGEVVLMTVDGSTLWNRAKNIIFGTPIPTHSVECEVVDVAPGYLKAKELK